MKKVLLSLLAGIVIGVIDIIPMIIQHLPWYETVSAFSLWVIVSFFNYSTDIKVKGFLKGMIISFCFWIPALFLVFPQGIDLLIMISATNLVLGAILGFTVEKIRG